MSGALIWELTKNNNAFLVKRNGVTFSAEKGNLTNTNSYKSSGLANHRAVDIRAAKEGGIVVSLKSSKQSAQRKPATQWNAVTHKKHFRSVARAIKNRLRGDRSDLKMAALARFSALSRAAKSKGVAKKRTRTGKRGTKKT
jgi:large subunit ribosomal protein L28e